MSKMLGLFFLFHKKRQKIIVCLFRLETGGFSPVTFQKLVEAQMLVYIWIENQELGILKVSSWRCVVRAAAQKLH